MRDALADFDGSMKVGGKTNTNFSYADDVVQNEGTIEELQDMVNKVNKASNRFRLTLSTTKTKATIITRKISTIRNGEQLFLNNEKIVSDLIHLGCLLSNDYDDSRNIRCRLTIA